MKLRIRHKLFFTILLTSTIVATSLSLFLQWNFDRGFISYVENQELAHLDQIAAQLVVHYASNGKNWQFMDGNHSLWQAINDQIFFSSQGKRPVRRLEEGHPPFSPPPRERRNLGPRVVLYDVDKRLIIGGPKGPELNGGNLIFQPINFQEKAIGYLGLMPATELSYSGDLLFVEQQKENFMLVALGMIGLSVLLTFPLTIHLLRPINELTNGTRKLIGGQFRTRIPVKTADELGQLSNDFNMLAMTLEENEKARKQWVADISHELRTPLSVLRGDAEALLDGVRKLEPQAIEPLHNEIIHLERLVNDLYELSMSDIGALTYKKIEVDPVSILHDSIGLYENRFIDKGIELTLDIPDNLSLKLLGDPDRIHQLYSNLMSNSLRYTNSPGRLEVSAEHYKNTLNLSFKDSAPGVAPEHLPKLFDRLYQAESSRNRARKGAGLGLAICKNIVDAHQGTITVKNSMYGGLEFSIAFPLYG